jgi:hypothetical protein
VVPHQPCPPHAGGARGYRAGTRSRRGTVSSAPRLTVAADEGCRASSIAAPDRDGALAGGGSLPGRCDSAHAPDIHGTERTLAGQLRGMLALVDHLAPRDTGTGAPAARTWSVRTLGGSAGHARRSNDGAASQNSALLPGAECRPVKLTLSGNLPNVVPVRGHRARSPA